MTLVNNLPFPAPTPKHLIRCEIVLLETLYNKSFRKKKHPSKMDGKILKKKEPPMHG